MDPRRTNLAATFHFSLSQTKALISLTSNVRTRTDTFFLREPTLKFVNADQPAKLSEVQISIIDVFVHLFQLVGLPKSVGEIYGLLFTSATLISSEDVMARLDISSGSVSQGLRLLRSLGAVRTAYVAGDRRDHYVAETDLRKLASSFLRGNIEHQLVNGEERLLRLNNLVSRSDPLPGTSREFLEERIGTLRTWNERARALLPMVIQVLH